MKKLLFIGLDYYHYPQVIIEGFEKMGYSVEFYPIEPRTLIYKTSRYLLKSFYNYKMNTYHRKIINQKRSIDYDIVFFITTHFFSLENLKLLKDTQKNARFISYHWDSVQQYDYLQTNVFFDKVLSFDRNDCLTYNDVDYLPLFASGIYNKKSSQENTTIDIYTVSSIVNPERYILINNFKVYCLDNNISFYFHLKVTLITYVKIILTIKSFPKDVSFKTLDQEVMKGVVESSNAVLDVKNNKQSGLTMRVIENIVAGKKIVTTNTNILHEEFYDENSIFILKSDNISQVKEFVKKRGEMKEYQNLTLDHWLERIIS